MTRKLPALQGTPLVKHEFHPLSFIQRNNFYFSYSRVVCASNRIIFEPLLQSEDKPAPSIESEIMPEWTQTKLWGAIKSRDPDSKLQHIISMWMEKIRSVLSDGSTSPRDFTLHDANHSFRVAERIIDFIPSTELERLSNYELALLLLSAYLHDIGMTPNQSIIENHFGYILSLDRNLLSSTERTEIHEWLDRDRPEISLPITLDTRGFHGVKIAEEIIAYYTRHKHNDWSENWITDNLTDINHTLYSGCTNDIIAICRSHHEGIIELRQSRFDAKIVDNPPQTVNLRWLSALLRIADVVEFDPERTPPVILEHRNISPKSRVYWYKDHSISFHIDGDQNQVILSARTPSSKIHNAVISTSNWVDEELNTCITLHQEGAFKRGVIPSPDRDRYNWPWPARLTRDIKEEGEKFTYIEGAFRPDVPKILALLSGTALYGDPFAAIREVLQNSVDAIQEQIAYQRLQEDDPLDFDLVRRLQSLHKIRVTISQIDKETWVSFSDTGIGMDRLTIEKYLLVSGSPPRPGTKSLERLAKARGFDVGRTGQFGIGVLSYFMISDQVDIITRRSSEAGDNDNTAWNFSTDGITSFGELKKLSRSARGTEVKLRIRKSFLEKGSQHFINEFLKYITNYVRKIPCRLELRNEIDSSLLLQSGPSWTGKESDLKAGLFRALKFRPRKQGLLTNAEIENNSAKEKLWHLFSDRAERLARLEGPHEFRLPEAIGNVRCWLPYFENDAGLSLGYFFGEKDRHFAKDNDIDIYYPSRKTITSWKGFQVSSKNDLTIKRRSERDIGVFEVDLERNASISANRSDLNFNMKSIGLSNVEDNFFQLCARFLKDSFQSLYTAINHVATAIPLDKSNNSALIESYYWIHYSNSDKKFDLAKIKLPSLEYHVPMYDNRMPVESIKSSWGDISILQPIKNESNQFEYLSRSLPGGNLCIIKSETHHIFSFGIQWKSISEAFPDKYKIPHKSSWPMFSYCLFPDGWEGIAAIRTGYKTIINNRHPILKAIEECDEFGHNGQISDEEAFRMASEDKLLGVKFLVDGFTGDESYWTALKDNFPEIYNRWWTNLGSQQSIYYIVYTAGWENNDCIEITSAGGNLFEGAVNLNSITHHGTTIAIIDWSQDYAIIK